MKKVLGGFLVFFIAVWAYVEWLSVSPRIFSLDEILTAEISKEADRTVVGAASTATHAYVLSQILHDKNGGYTAKGFLYHLGIMDNMPSFEVGAIKASYEFANVGLSESFTKQVSNDTYDDKLKSSQTFLNYPPHKWTYPSSLNNYNRSLEGIREFIPRMLDKNQPDAQFYTRSNGLRAYFTRLQGLLGDYNGSLTESVGRFQYNTNLELDLDGEASTNEPIGKVIKTPYLKVDNVYHQARGVAWAVVHHLRAIERDFKDVLVAKNSLRSLRQMIYELEQTQGTRWNPMVLNGDPDGYIPNHSLVLANRFGRAIIILQKLTLEMKEG
ncbi:DUF2333 family protein [Vibrio sp. D431a]|uniref:DUF2333 family protein n=1 Tax=Vibrio sp. D431a TaxID=2837388 RepID=UPI002555C8D1|nr:DUF2333 family protein [Vibrio sp. D431a]MDK9790661.1 DUF2333 family protein [Vibrio sp. D431a]